jgi:hypothetical protein
MKTVALIALAGVASTATAQDLTITIAPTGGDNWSVTAQYSGALPGAATAIDAVWSDASFNISGDAPITFGTGWNPGFTSALFGDPAITNDGSNSVTWVGVQPGAPLGAPDASNPLFVDDFTYAGTAAGLSAELVGQNTALFSGDPLQPFGTIALYQDAQGNAGELTFEIVIVPAPASAALLGLGGLAAVRRRR